jgi:hypothetical protein
MPTKKTVQVAFRLPMELLARVDRYAERLRAEVPWANANRADAVRALLARALDEVEGGGQVGRGTRKH